MPEPRLKSLSIENFRGFYESQTILFAIPDGTRESSGLTVIVGPNNAGKTTILEALKRFFKGNPPQFDREERHSSKNVFLSMANNSDEVKTLRTSGGSVGELANNELYPNFSNFYFINSRRFWATYFDPSKIEHTGHRNTSINNEKSGTDNEFGRRMITIDGNPALKTRFDTLLIKLIPDFSGWKMELQRGTNYISYTTGNGDEHSSELFGDGVTSLFKIAADLFENLNDEVLVIDEPELSLHPQSQKALANVLAEYSKTKQIIITTHSPFFIRWVDMQNGAKIIRVSKESDKSSKITELTDATLASLLKLTNDWQKPYLLDNYAKEIFFSKNVVFVEGQEDMSLLTQYIVDNSININFEIFAYGSGGATNIYNFLLMASDLGLRAGALFDGDQVALKVKCGKDFKANSIVEILSTNDIRDKHTNPNDDKSPLKVKGLFDVHGKIKKTSVKEINNIIKKFNNFFK